MRNYKPFNRIIKFRLWDRKNTKWINGPNKENSLDGCNLLGEHMLFGEFCLVSLDRLNDMFPMQYIGIDDRHGKNIFEGDIVKLGWQTSGSQGFLCKVVYWNYAFCLEPIWSNPKSGSSFIPDSYYEFKHCEVVGNVFENPDLTNDQP